MEMLDNDSLKRHSRSASPADPPSEKRHKDKHHKDNKDKKEKKDKQHKKEKKEKHHKDKEHKQQKHRSKDRKDKEKSRSEHGDASPHKDKADERAMAENSVDIPEEAASGNPVSKFYGMASSESEPEPGEIEEPGALPDEWDDDMNLPKCNARGSPQEKDGKYQDVALSNDKDDLDARSGDSRSRDRGDGDREDCRRDKDREREKAKEKDREWEKAREKEREREREKVREKEREREKAREKEREREKERDKEREREKERDKERERAKERARERDRDKERRDQERRDRDRDRKAKEQRDREASRSSHRSRSRSRDHGADRSREWERERERMHERVRAREGRNGASSAASDRDRDRGRGYDKEHGSRDRDRRGRDKREREEPDVDEDHLLATMNAALTAEEEEERAIEERRRKRAEILAKHKKTEEHAAAVAAPTATEINSREDDSDDDSKDKMDEDFTGQLQKGPQEQGVDEQDGADMFTDDMFDEKSPDDFKKTSGAAKGFVDNWDDVEGYYRARVGEVLKDRYQVTGEVGRGVFSTVLLAADLESRKEVAIKVIRANDIMYKAAQQETVILQKLAGADPENKRHCIKILSHFEFRDHVFMVFEPMAMNLREVLKKYGRNVGLSVAAVQKFAKQMLVALKHMRNCGVLHADIKLDNILVNDKHNLIKLCDFGSAMFAGQNEITPYLVSRFYRPPEVVLGLEYSFPMDLWAIGCCLFELFTGKIAFPGKTNNEMLKLFMDLMGPFPKKMLKKAQFTERHFDNNYNFSLMEEDPVTKGMIRRIIANPKPGKDMATVLNAKAKNLSEEEKMKVFQLADLLSRMLELDPDKRMKVSEALQHPFIKNLESRF